PRSDPYYRDRDTYDYRDRDSYVDGRDRYGRNPEYLIGRVMADLNRAAVRAQLDGHERKHFEDVADSLREFEARGARRKLECGKLDKAIHNLAHLAEADRVSGRDRDLLARDLADLREFRAGRRRYDADWNYRPNWAIAFPSAPA